MGDGSILRDINLMFERAIHWAFKDEDQYALFWLDRAEALIKLMKEN